MSNNQKFARLIIHQNKTHALKRFHPWVFSGAVKAREGKPDQGDVVEVVSEKGEFLGIGHFGTGSVSARLFSFEKIDSLEALWSKRFRQALALRRNIGLSESQSTNAYRLINAEGDEMPGLIVDWYNGTAVVQCHSKGMNAEKEKFVEILKEEYGDRLKAVYDKSAATLNHKAEDTRHKTQDEINSPSEIRNRKFTDGYLFGTNLNNVILENGHKFMVNWEEGQKTGFFLDQRDNRQLLSSYAKGKKVLNTFCYSGGFSVYALKAGASLVHSVDSSSKAIEWTKENALLNDIADRHEGFSADIFDFVKAAKDDYDIVVLDPPAFAKSQSARHNAIQAYTRLNQAVLKRIKPGGIIFTFSCSQVVSPDMFTGAVTSAAIESKRKVKVLHHLTQPADHPVSIFNPEGLYLKGLVLYVE